MYTRFYVILLCSLFLLLGCAEKTPSIKERAHASVDITELSISPETTLLGTLANGLLLFANYEATAQTMFTYDVETGEMVTIYTPTMPMRQVIVHPSGETLIIVSAKSEAIAHIELYTANMDKRYETDVVSYDTYVAFDAVEQEQFSVTAFTKNYEATVYTYQAYKWARVQAMSPFVTMHNGSLYTFTDQQLTKDAQTIASNAAHILVGQSDVYYVTTEDPTTLMTSTGAIQFLNPIVSLHEQFGDVYAWIQDGATYQLIQLQDMTPLITADAPVPFFVAADKRFIVYGEQYEWLQQRSQQPVKWLSIN